MTPKVLHVLGQLRTGGAEIRTLQLLRSLGDEARSHTIVTLAGVKGELAPQFEAIGVAVVPLRARSIAFFIRLFKLMRGARFDAVHSHVDRSAGYLLPVARLAGVRTRICHFRSDTVPAQSRLARLRHLMLNLGISWAATSIVAVSPGTLEAACGASRGDERCHVLHNGIDVARYRDVVAADLSADFNIATGRTVIIHIGNGGIQTKKRDRAIRILARVRESTDAVLLIVGRDGQDAMSSEVNRRMLTELAEKIGVSEAVVFAGERSDIPALLAASHCLLMTSTLEGVPGVVLEGLATGLPVVATRLPGTEYIQHKVGALTLIDASASDETWASALLAVICAPPNRAEVAASVERSPFNGDRSVHEYRAIWAGNGR